MEVKDCIKCLYNQDLADNTCQLNGLKCERGMSCGHFELNAALEEKKDDRRNFRYNSNN